LFVGIFVTFLIVLKIQR